MLGVAAHVHDAAVHLRVERLHAAPQHLGEARVVGDVLHLQARGSQRLGRAARAQQLDILRREGLAQLHEAGLVAHG